MSMSPHSDVSIPEETVRVARAALPRGNIYLTMRDQLGTLYEDEDFAAVQVLEDCLTNEPGGRVYEALVRAKKASRVSGNAYGSPLMSTRSVRTTDSVTGSCSWNLVPCPGCDAMRTNPRTSFTMSCTTSSPSASFGVCTNAMPVATGMRPSSYQRAKWTPS